MGFLRNLIDAAKIAPFVVLVVLLLGIFDANVFSAVFSSMGILVLLVVVFCEVSMARI